MMLTELLIKPMEADEEGWTEVCLAESLPDAEGDAEGDTIGYVRVVEGTEQGPHVWWDARIIEDNTSVERRFISYEAALLSLAMRRVAPDIRRNEW